MTTGQKVIKYLAISLAFFIIGLIITGIYAGFSFASGIVGKKKISTEPLKTTSIETEINRLIIDLKASQLTIKVADRFKVESNSPYLKIEEKYNTLIMQETDYNILRKYNYSVILYIPNNTILDHTDIEVGVGDISIDQLFSKQLELEIGVGRTNIKNINISGKTIINNGTGELTIASGILNSVEMELGVGSAQINASLLGNSKIELGIGNLTLNLDNIDNYTFDINKGLGDVMILDDSISDNKIYGNGKNHISIDGGIGSINIK